MNYFCTYFDRNYVSRALTMYESLLQHCGEFHIYALCMDPESYKVMNSLRPSYVTAIELSRLEEYDAELLGVKPSRSRVEYFYTVGPAFLCYVLHKHPEIDVLTYLDADLYFFSNPAPLLEEMTGQSVGIIEHRFPARLRKMNKFGTYNVGWVSFRRDEVGFACLAWWRARCLEWCYDRLDNGRFADQKYLDEFPVRFKRVHNIQHKGANLAPWNLANHKITIRDQQLFVDNEPLIFFHFHGLRMVAPWLFDSNVGWYNTILSSLVRRHIYRPYIRRLVRRSEMDTISSNARERSRRLGPFLRACRQIIRHCRALVMRAYILEFPAQ